MKKQLVKNSYAELKSYEKYIRDCSGVKKIRQSRLSSFYALESLFILNDDLKNESIKRKMCKNKKS